jgi:hypothetical protein
MHRSKQHHYSITSSAITSRDGGTSRPNILAVWVLMTSSNFDACTTGRSNVPQYCSTQTAFDE